MADYKAIFVTISILLLFNSFASSSSSILSWLTGGNQETTRVPTLSLPLSLPPIIGNVPGRVPSSPAIEYPEESGECSHWGDMSMTLPSSASSSSMPTSLYPTSPTSGDRYYGVNKGIPLPGELIGSHRTLPVGSIVTVTNLIKGNTITVRVVPQRSLPVYGRIMDLSPAAFAQLENPRVGLFTCAVRIVQLPPMNTHSLASHSFESGLKNRPGSNMQYGYVPKVTSYEGEERDEFSDHLEKPVGYSYKNGKMSKKGLSTVTFYDPDGNIEAVAAPETY